MHSAYIALAHGKGFVRMTRDSSSWEVEHFTGWINPHTMNPSPMFPVELVKRTHIDRIDGEDVRSSKARAIAAVQMLMHWPAMLAELAQEARMRSAIAGTLAVPPAADAGGLVLPPGVTR